MSATNSYTVVVADAHSHSVTVTPVIIDGGEQGDTIAAKIAAAAVALDGLRTNPGQTFAAFTTAADTLTITVTQP